MSESTGALLFDLDGTLVDSAPDISDALGRALAECGLDAPGHSAICTFIGNGAARLVHRAITRDPDGKADLQTFERVYAQFLVHYEQRLYRRSVVYPGVSETLGQLNAAGWSLGCITNKPERFTLPLLRAASLESYLDIVLSGDSLARRKPDPDPIIHACEQIRIPLERAVMIGDSAADLTAARRAGVRAVCVSYGYAGELDLAAAGADALIGSMPELPGTLDRLLA